MDEVARLLGEQAGVLSRRQALELGVTEVQIARLLRRREWVVVHPGVYVQHGGPLTWLQRARAAVLYSWPAALMLESAMRAHEGPGRRLRDESVIHVAVARGRRLVEPPGVRVHHLRDLEARVLWNLGPPRVRYDDSVLDVAAAARTDLDAIAVLANACGARRTTAARLLGALGARSRLPRRPWIRDILVDVAEGTCSVLEHGYLTRVERPHGLPRGRRQAAALSGQRTSLRDVLYEQVALLVELDGRLFHTSPEARDRDLERDLDSVVDRREETVRLGYAQVFDRGCRTAAKLGSILERRGWSGAAQKCPTCSGLLQPG
ncbi:MAG: hypothetical protein JWO11_1108 [Nocardioides sp.]|nr:hypothetical protein [Nocardioides sp.]